MSTTPMQDAINQLYKVNGIFEGTNLPSVPVKVVDSIVHLDSLSLLGLA